MNGVVYVPKEVVEKNTDPAYYCGFNDLDINGIKDLHSYDPPTDETAQNLLNNSPFSQRMMWRKIALVWYANDMLMRGDELAPEEMADFYGIKYNEAHELSIWSDDISRDNPLLADAYLSIGKKKRERGDIKAALIALKNASTFGSEESAQVIEQMAKYNWKEMPASYFSERASYKEYDEDFNGAIDDLTKAIEIEPKNTNLYNKRGMYKGLLDRNEEAIDDYCKSIEINPNDEIPFNERGISKYILGNYKEAIDDFSSAVRIKPDYVLGFINRAESKARMDDYEGANEDFSKAILIAPDDSKTYLQIGNAKKELNDLKGACEYWKKAAELGNYDADFLVEEHCQ